MKTVNALKKTIHALSITLALGCLITAPTFAAGPGSDGGGNSAEDAHGKRRLLDLIEQDELEYFDFNMGKYDQQLADGLSKHSLREKYEGLNLDYTFEDALQSAAGIGGNLPHIYNHIFTRSLRWAFTDSDLKEINDTGIIRINNPKTKRQLAIQKDGLVIVNRKEFELLDNESKAALNIHESALRAVKVINPDLLDEEGTAPVRTFVKQFIKYIKGYPSSTTPKEAVMDAYKALNIYEKTMENTVLMKGSIPLNTRITLRKNLPAFPASNICFNARHGICLAHKSDDDFTNPLSGYKDVSPSCVILNSGKVKKYMTKNASFLVKKIGTRSQVHKEWRQTVGQSLITLVSKDGIAVEMACSSQQNSAMETYSEFGSTLIKYFTVEAPRTSQTNEDDSISTTSNEAAVSSAE